MLGIPEFFGQTLAKGKSGSQQSNLHRRFRQFHRFSSFSHRKSLDVTEDENRNSVLNTTGATVHQVKLEPDQAEKKGDSFVLKSDSSIRVDSRAYKMSKSRRNVVNPDEIVADYGADALRLYEMFMGPLEQSKPWSMAGVKGVRNFLERAWRMIVDESDESNVLNAAVVAAEPTEEQLRMVHKTIKSVTLDIESLSFNTAIARMMEFINFFTKSEQRPRQAIETFVLLLSPFAPHIAEELWKTLGHEDSLAYQSWPQFDEALTYDANVEIPVQINGKNRSKIIVPRGTSKTDLEAAAKADERMAELLADKTIRKSIVVPDRLVNFVVA